MSSLTRRAFSLAVVIAAVTAASFAKAGDGPRTIEHRLGTTELGGKPHRVVALEFSFVQALDALGVVPVGIADDNQPKRIEQLLGKTIEYASVGTRLEPNLELISSLAPDLIIADEIRHSAIYQQLGSIAPTIVLNSWEGDYETIKTSVVTIADALGDRARGEQTIADHESRIATLVARIPKGEQRRILLAVATPDSMSLHTSASFTGSVFKAMGLTPAIDSSDAVESGAGLERLVSVAPDILLVATDPGGTVLDQWQDNAVWNAIPAVKNKMVFEVDRNQFARFRGLKTAEMIAGEILAKVYDAN
ncbi:ABC transporter substrate-binding protein [Ensifer adhaerens]|uniref:ABC transporter substrate-binding protein n=1 Tax=Ensifer adhaerens TaxID=106592 RepID=UPI001CBBD933|nr:ABC transporter substrate-binding protein [Ensifer adhaerens]MBZ7924196.1 ABC transporter substrate-binding protein [Ensifer adhaerens]UAX96547.1 ABC transporter substrate-binding protein [Ensifer adhaerens]UAY04109.1 ABC transporter substrate-binding protein [Ensifer adhaerens]UAY12095.1 ABC transporter substrate-binding protein [Ensifer adhaerens]